MLWNTLYSEKSQRKLGVSSFRTELKTLLWKGQKLWPTYRTISLSTMELDMPPSPVWSILCPLSTTKWDKTRAQNRKTKREQEKREGKTFLRFDIWSMAFYVAHQRTNGCSTRIINFFPCAHYNTVALRRATKATTTIAMFMRWCALIAIRSELKTVEDPTKR